MSHPLSDKERVLIDSYQRTGCIKTAAFEAKMLMIQAFKTLKIRGAMFVADRLKYGTEATRMGARAELEFKKLVPQARPQNAVNHIHPSYDFVVAGQKVDVKAAAIRDRKAKKEHLDGHKCWSIKLVRHNQDAMKADFYVIFLMQNETSLSDGYEILVIPKELCSDVRQINIRPNIKDHWAWDFKIEPDELTDFFEGLGGGAVDGEYIPKPDATRDVFTKNNKRDFLKIELNQCKKLSTELAAA